MSEALSADAIELALTDIEGWSVEENKLHREFVFNNFKEAISFLVRVAFSAEEMNHHPEIHNVYNRVQLWLTTHDAGNQITDKDVVLARTINRFSWI